MNEKQLQSKVVIWFSQSFPQFRGCLFEVNNDTYNVKHAIQRRAVGMIAGVSDLLLIHPETKQVAGIELKAPETRHDTQHLKQQIDWGLNIPLRYCMSANFDEIIHFIISFINKDSLYNIVPSIDFSKKTHKFT